jgi:hypothetical protein
MIASPWGAPKKRKKKAKKKAAKAPARKKAKAKPRKAAKKKTKKKAKAPARKKTPRRRKGAPEPTARIDLQPRPDLIVLGWEAYGGEGWSLGKARADRGHFQPDLDCKLKHKYTKKAGAACSHPLPEKLRKSLPSAKEIVSGVTWQRADQQHGFGRKPKGKKREELIKKTIASLKKDMKQWDTLRSKTPGRDPGYKRAIDYYVTGREHRGKWLRDFLYSKLNHMTFAAEELNNLDPDWRKSL